MKRLKLVLLVVFFAALMVLASTLYPKLKEAYTGDNTESSEEVIENRETAADFTVYDSDGNPVSLSDFTGKPTVVNFWATWCTYCVQELPGFNSVYEEYKGKVNFIMLDLPDGYRETIDGALQFVSEEGYTFPVYFDTDYSAANAYSVSGIPMTLLVDEDGNLYKTHTGLMDESTLRNYIESLVND